MCSLRGHLGTEVNTELGMKYLHRASNTSDPDCPQASYVFGLIQLGEIKGIALPDPTLPETSGIGAMERAAWLGFAPALLRMGMAWQGGEKGYDSLIAMRYFHIASRQQQYLRFKGDMNAGLGGCAEVEISKWMLCGSEGIFEPNEEYAFFFAKLASEFGNGIAEFAVGYFYEVGIYVQQDIQAALIWYGIAASHESADAVERLKELSLSRKNTITKSQHKRALTLKGRGSMKHFRRKADTSSSTKGSAYPDPEYPDVLRCSSVSSENPRSRPRVMSESAGNRSSTALAEGSEEPIRLKSNRLSLPAEAYTTNSATRMTPPHHQKLRQSSSASPTRQRGVSTMLPSTPQQQGRQDRRTSSPTMPSEHKPALFPGSQVLPTISTLSLASRRPLPLPADNGSVSLSNSSTPVLSPAQQNDVPEQQAREPIEKLDTGAPEEKSEPASPQVKEAPLPNTSPKKRFSVMGMFFGSAKEEETPATGAKSSPTTPTKSETNAGSPSGTLRRGVDSMIIEPTAAADVPTPPSSTSPQPAWAEKGVPRAATLPVQTASYQTASAAARVRSQSPRKQPAQSQPHQVLPPESMLFRKQTPPDLHVAGHDLVPPPSMGAVRGAGSKTPPRGSPSPTRFTPSSRYSPSRASTINSTSTSTSAESESTPASSVQSVYSMRSGSSSPIRRPNSNVIVIQAIPGGKGAKTFEEMGIPVQSKAKGDCIIM